MLLLAKLLGSIKDVQKNGGHSLFRQRLWPPATIYLHAENTHFFFLFDNRVSNTIEHTHIHTKYIIMSLNIAYLAWHTYANYFQILGNIFVC